MSYYRRTNEELFKWGTDCMWKFVEVPIGEINLSCKKSRCRGCYRVMPRDTFRYSVDVIHTYGRMQPRKVTVNYCIKCGKLLLRTMKKELNKKTKKLDVALLSYDRKTLRQSQNRIKEVLLIEAI